MSLSGARKPRVWARIGFLVLGWGLAGLVAMCALIYVRLLAGPIPLDFLSDRVQSTIAGIVEDDFDVEWQAFGVSLDGPFNPVFRLASVELRERGSDAVVGMEALEIDVSAVGVLIGRPNARITLDTPHFEVVQDLTGPRLSRLEVLEDLQSGETTVAIHARERADPAVRIEGDGLAMGSGADARRGTLGSDNAILISMVETIDRGLSGFARQALAGQVSAISVKGGSVAFLDTVYGLYREFRAVELDMRAGQQLGGISARFAAEIAGRALEGRFVRTRDADAATVRFAIDGLDFSTLLPFLDDPAGIAALRGQGGLAGDLAFEGAERRVTGGRFRVDLVGTYLRLGNDMFDVRSAPFAVDWIPDEARFHFADVAAAIGQSRATLSGDVVLGYDQQFGPTMAMDVVAREVYLHPDDMAAPDAPLDHVRFRGWSAPLYGAVGIDSLVATAGAANLVASGRIDNLREGIGLALSMSGQGFSADAVKRLWPHVFAPEARAWLVDYVDEGVITRAQMDFDFPVGSIALDGTPRPIPEDAIRIEVAADAVDLLPFASMPQLDIASETRVLVRDNQVTVGVDRAVVAGTEETVVIEHAAFLNQDTAARRPVFEISGDISGPIPALLALSANRGLGALEDDAFGFDIADLTSALAGDARATAIATLHIDDIGQVETVDYTLNGSVSDLSTREAIGGVRVSEADFAFTASQEGFNANGSGMLGAIPFDLEASRSGDGMPDIRVASTFDAQDARAVGLDLSAYVSGQVRLVAKPLEADRYQVSADLSGAELRFDDIGVRKAAGEAGGANAVIVLGEDTIAVSEVDLGFGPVRLAGALAMSGAGELESADFSTFRISPGDRARLSVARSDGGYALSLEGTQFDMRPVLSRFFNLEPDAEGGTPSALDGQRIALRVALDKAIGHFGTAASDVALDLVLDGDRLKHIDLSAGLGGGRSLSARTETSDAGRVMNFASGDVGGLLRFVGLYSQLVGGEGRLALRQDSATDQDVGTLEIHDFSIVDEDKIATLLDSSQLEQIYAQRGNSLDFNRARADFVRTPDRIVLRDAALYGDSVGGTARGNIALDEGVYDLVGTYVPLFGINNAFQQIPLIGPIFGGREGEGLIGVTFAVRGPLAEPEFLVNPVSILAPGVFRSLFEYRARGETGAAQ